jgi:TIR domain
VSVGPSVDDMTTESQMRTGPRPFRMFLSYRREDASGHAGRLYDAITARFPAENVFMDIDTIEPGVDFVEVVEDAVGSCDVLLALIGQRWLQATDESGAPRLHDEYDYVRLEIEAALDRRIRVIPVLIQDSHMPSAQALPDGMRAFARRNAIGISDHRWRYDVEQLLRVLERLNEASNSDSSTVAQLSAPPPVTALKSDSDESQPAFSPMQTFTTGATTQRVHSISDEEGPRDGQPVRRSFRATWLWWTIGAVVASVILSSVLLALFVFSKPSNPSVVTPKGLNSDGFVTATGGGSQTTPALHISTPSDLLVAMVSTEYEQSITVFGGGLSWTKVARFAGTSTTAGEDIEVWMARAKRATENVAVTSFMTGPSPWLQSVTVMAFRGAGGVGAIASACHSPSGCTSNSPTPRTSVTPTRTGSMVIGVGYDYSDNVMRFAARDQTMDQQAFDVTERATMWVQHANSLTTAGSPVTVRDAVAATDTWALTAFEVKPSHP